MSAEQPQRVDLLAARVRWLDRYRRAISVPLALLAIPLIAMQLSANWPRVHAVMLCFVGGVVTWWLTEVVLAYVTALWETEVSQIERDRGLPKAIVHEKHHGGYGPS